MPLEHFRITGIAVSQIFLLAAIGYLLVKRRFLSNEGLDAISNLVMDVTLPVLIFCQLIKDFSFQAYKDWWVFPLLSLLVTVIGLVSGFIFLPLIFFRFLTFICFRSRILSRKIAAVSKSRTSAAKPNPIA